MLHRRFIEAPGLLGLIVVSIVLLASCSSLEEGPLTNEGEQTTSSRTARLLPPPGSAYARFGHAVATDGDTVVVGAWGEAGEAGAAHVYEPTPHGWARVARVAPDDPTPGARFGYALDVDASRIAVGALYEPSQGREAGAVYIFERDGADWAQTAKLVPAGPTEYAHFGRSVALEGDHLAVGAPGPGASSVHTFVRTAGGWQRERVLEHPSAAAGTRFGTSLALSEDMLAVGAWTEDRDETGFVIVYRRSQSGWAEAARLPGSETGDRFGYAVSLEGRMLAVGAPDARDGPGLHLYELVDGTWVERNLVLPAGHSDELGHVVALHGRVLLAGDPVFDGRGNHSGQVLQLEPGKEEAASIAPEGATDGSSFGFSVAASAGVVVVGAVGDDTRGTAAGAAYVFY